MSLAYIYLLTSIWIIISCWCFVKRAGPYLEFKLGLALPQIYPKVNGLFLPGRELHTLH